MAYEGEDRRGSTRDTDWHEHKLSIMSDLNTLKSDTRDTARIVTDMKISLEVLQSKLIMITAGSSLVVTAVISFVMDRVLK